jgi:hypothetical protein
VFSFHSTDSNEQVGNYEKRKNASSTHGSDNVVQSDFAAASNFYWKKLLKCSLGEIFSQARKK